MQRKTWLDYAKFLLLMLVVVYHVPQQTNIDHYMIQVFIMSAFFALSGFTFNIAKFANFKQFAIHRGKRLVVPYFTFFVLFYAFWLIVGRRMAGGAESGIPLSTPVVEHVLGKPYVVLHIFWFLACLITIQLLYYPIARYVPAKWRFAVCVAISFTWYAIKDVDVWNLSNAVYYLPFYAFGNCFKGWLDKVEFGSRDSLWATLLMAVCVAGAVVEYNTDLCFSVTLKIAVGLGVIPFFICVMKWVAKLGHSRIIEVLAVNAIILLAFQNYLISFERGVINHFMGTMFVENNVWLRVPLAIVTVAIIYPIILFIIRYMPWMVGEQRKKSTIK